MKNLVYALFLLIILAACKDDEIDPKTSFTKIYDSFRSDQSYYPIDIVATETGFLVLTSQSLKNTDDDRNYSGVQLIELDEEGNYVAETTLNAEQYDSPIGDFMTIDDMYYFVMMDNNKRAQLASVGSSIESLVITPLSNGLTWPLAASLSTNDNIILLSFDGTDQTIISLVNLDGTATTNAAYSIGTNNDIAAVIFDHFTDPERYGLPFFCGQLSETTYYFNGIYDHTLSLVFTNLGQNPTGVCQGQGTDGGLTALLPLPSGSYSLFGYQFNDNFIQPNQAIANDVVTSSINFMNVPFSEYKSRTPANIVSYERNGTMYSVIAAETQSRQIALNVFDIATSESVGVLKIGNINPYTLSSIKVDEDNNLLVLGTTLVSGRFPRVFLKKISEKEMSDLIQ
ncbi:hypothetical protein [Reichenbachiella sp. MSK19-1]|uniref:hypothetical protein n=1 Tax=Reichenbachiella sp. MSK19-1 TaxID=1897631 RepID=UPI000E6BB3DD|nr:hypothetical protein [Reichenbachiella sp. MSK19-1]RJE74194.1 hypothetical protein BGP76_13470 [Reichenbachiella sp. MSK19-1]